MIKRPPSECGEFETGCFTFDANNLALIADTTSEYHKDISDELCPMWNAALSEYQRREFVTDRRRMETFSLGWLLTNAVALYHRVAADAAQAHDNPADKYEQLTVHDRDTIRDWFCWLHRHLVHETKETQRWNAQQHQTT